MCTYEMECVDFEQIGMSRMTLDCIRREEFTICLKHQLLAGADTQIQKMNRKKEDTAENASEGSPRNEQSQHGEPRFSRPIQVAERRALRHEDHDSSVPIERRDRQKMAAAQCRRGPVLCHALKTLIGRICDRRRRQVLRAGREGRK